MRWTSQDDVELRQAAGLRVLRQGEDLWIERPGASGDHDQLRQRHARFSPADDTTFAVRGDGDVWRLRPDGEVLFCEPGATTYGCRTFRQSSAVIATGRVSQAYQLDGELWLVGDEGIRQIDLRSRRDSEHSLPAVIRGLDRIERLQRADSQLWLLTSDGRLFRRDQGKTWRAPRNVDNLVIDDQQKVWIEVDGRWSRWSGDAYEEVDPATVSVPQDGSIPPLADRWPEWRRRVVKMPDGEDHLDPVRDFEVTEAGLIGVRSSGPESLAPGGRTTIRTAARSALNASWLSWQGPSTGFEVRIHRGTQTFPADRLIEDGRLIFESLTVALAESPQRLHAAGRHGVLIFPGLSTSLSREEIVYHPEDLTGRLIAAHGRFLTPGKSLVAYDTATRSDEAFEGDRTYRVHPFGNSRIVLRENVWSGRLTEHRINPGGGTSADGAFAGDALGERGFTWDARHDVAYRGPVLMVLSDAGLHLWNMRQATFDIAPPNLSPDSAELTTGDDGELYLRDGAVWQRWDGRTWVALPSKLPGDGVRASRGGLIWQRRGPTLNVFAEQPVHGFDLSKGSGSLGFSADRLQAAAVHGEQFLLQSDAFLEIGDHLNGLRGLAPKRSEGQQTDGFFSLVPSPGDAPILYRQRGQNVDQWDGASFFRRADDPRRDKRLLAKLGPLLLNAQGSRLLPELELRGRQNPRPIEVTTVGFPFDRVQAIGVLGENLFVQTSRLRGPGAGSACRRDRGCRSGAGLGSSRRRRRTFCR